MLSVRPLSHSQIPACLPTPNWFTIFGRRRSPASSNVFCCLLLASVHARLAATVLLPSCGMVLVIRIFLSGRISRSCRKRTARNRNFSAPKLPSSATETRRLSSRIETGSTGQRSKSSVDAGAGGPASNTSMLGCCATLSADPRLFCSAACSSSVARSKPEPSSAAFPPSALCNASNILLIVQRPEPAHRFLGPLLVSARPSGEHIVRAMSELLSAHRAHRRFVLFPAQAFESRGGSRLRCHR